MMVIAGESIWRFDKIAEREINKLDLRIFGHSAGGGSAEWNLE